MKKLLTIGFGIWVVFGLGVSLSWADAGHSGPEKKAPMKKEEHAHRGPHGGETVHGGGYEVELAVRGSDGILVCLADKDLKPVSFQQKEGKVLLQFSDNSKKDVPLQPGKESSCLEGAVDLKGINSFKAIVSLVLDGKRQNLRFQSAIAQ
ncbi:MAG: hypothetical protein WAO55_04430 [Candidatus Manganitrophaceae bacterium]